MSGRGRLLAAGMLTAVLAPVLATTHPAEARRAGPLVDTMSSAQMSSVGEQPALVLLVKYGQPDCLRAGAPCSPERFSTIGPPRHAAREWQEILNQRVNERYRAASYGRVHWAFRVVADPRSPDGWWSAPHNVQQYAAARNFGPNGIVSDAATTLLNLAIRRGAITERDVARHHRLLVIDNYHSRGGQEGGGVLRYTVPTPRRPLVIETTAAVAAENSNDSEALTAIIHELGHQLGEPDLYSTPCDYDGDGNLDPCRCPNIEPGGVARSLLGGGSDCVGWWDTMALDAIDRSFGAYTRMIAGWLSTAEPTTRMINARRFSGTVRLWPVERLPRSDRPTALRLTQLSDDDLVRTRLLARLLALLGSRLPYVGYQAECRRAENDDAGAPKSGVLLAWVDDSRPRDHPEQIVRSSSTQHIDEAVLEPGESYTNYTTGLWFSMRGFDQDGSCIVDANYTPPLLPNIGAPFAPIVGREPHRFVLRTSTPVFTATGIALGPQNRSRLEPIAPEKGHLEFLRFGVANRGTAPAAGGTATVRVAQPYAVTEDCGAEARPSAPVAARVKLPALRPGAGAIVGTPWRSRGSDSTGISITMQMPKDSVGSDNEIRSAFTFQTHSLASGNAVREQRSTVVLRAARNCKHEVSFLAVPLFVPPGWLVDINGADTPLRPGATRRVTIGVRAPTSAKAGTVVIPVEFRTAPAGLWDPTAAGEGDPEANGGIDVIARVVRGKGPAPFRIAATALHLPPNVPGPGAPPPPPPPSPPPAQPKPTEPSAPATTLAELVLAPTTVHGGETAKGTVTLGGPAPAGGASVSLSSSDGGVAKVPTIILVAAGSSSAGFEVSTKSLGSPTTVTISASYAGVTRTADLTVTPVPVAKFNPSLKAGYDEKADILTVKGSEWDPCGNEVELTLETKGGISKLGSVMPKSSGKFETALSKTGAVKGDTVRAVQVTCATKETISADADL